MLCIAVMLSGCLGTKHLKDDQKLLFRQHIKSPKGISDENLKDLYVQRANRRFLGLTIYHLVFLYYWGEKNYSQDKYIKKKEASEKKFDAKLAKTTSKKRIDNLNFRKQNKIEKYNKLIENGNLRMQWGEQISVYDSVSVQLTVDRFKAYLFSKGYFQNQVESKVKTAGKFATIYYTIKPSPRYRIDSIIYQVKDTALMKIVRQNNEGNFIKRGAHYDQDNLTKERERLDLLMKDNGYYDFSRQYIDFNMDTSFMKNHNIALILKIKDPAKRGYHKKFTIDEVTFTTDAGAKVSNAKRQTQLYRDIEYQYYTDKYKLRILSQRVFLKKGDLYSRSNTFSTQRQLGNVDAFKFVNINYDTSNGKFVANIFTNSLDQYEWTNEAGVNVTQGFPGPFYNVTFRKRNLFRGMEMLDITGRIGYEGVASVTSDQDIYSSKYAGLNASITFPQFIWFLKESNRFKLAKYNPKTKFTSGYSYVDRYEYKRTNISVATTYTWSNQRKQQYFFTPINLAVIKSVLIPSFQEQLDQQDSLGNYSLVNSFNPSFVTSMIFGSTWNFNNYGNKERTSSFLRAQFESGGTIWNFIDPSFITKQGLQYFKYLRLNVDYRRNHILDKVTSVAYRVDGGVAYSYADVQSLPYEKFFFAGGSNSVRAWRPRRLGQGSFKPPTNVADGKDPVKNGYFDYSYEQPSEILLEASAEFRRNIFGFLDGAVFIDVGNVWTFQPRVKVDSNGDPVANGNSQFKFNQFYKEFAVGTGFGLRFDLSFLILRFDVGMKIIDPARDPGDRFILNRVRFWNPYATKTVDGVGNTTYSNYREPVIYNIGIGYPF